MNLLAVKPCIEAYGIYIPPVWVALSSCILSSVSTGKKRGGSRKFSLGHLGVENISCGPSITIILINLLISKLAKTSHMLIFSTPREKLWVGSNDGWGWPELPTYYHDSDDDDPKIMMKMMITNRST